MTRIVSYVCDGCGVEIDNGEGRSLPEGWLLPWVGACAGPLSWWSGKHLCSTACFWSIESNWHREVEA